MVAELGSWGVFQSAAWFLHQQVHRLTAETQEESGGEEVIQIYNDETCEKEKKNQGQMWFSSY